MTEGVDYFVRFVRFPNAANESTVVVNDDGTFDIYLNTFYPSFVLARRLTHELRHLQGEHFYVDLPIRRIEAQADGEPENIVLNPPKGFIPHFFSPESFAHWFTVVTAQVGMRPEDCSMTKKNF